MALFEVCMVDDVFQHHANNVQHLLYHLFSLIYFSYSTHRHTMMRHYNDYDELVDDYYDMLAREQDELEELAQQEDPRTRRRRERALLANAYNTRNTARGRGRGRGGVVAAATIVDPVVDVVPTVDVTPAATVDPHVEANANVAEALTETETVNVEVDVDATRTNDDANVNDNTNGSDSEIEIVCVRSTPTVTTAIDEGDNQPQTQNANVSVELIADELHSDNDDDDEDEDDIIMLDGKPVQTTDELLRVPTASNTSNDATATTKTLKDVTCAICMDKLTDAVAAACGHVFCADCIYRALASSKETHDGRSGARVGPRQGKCPMCRKVVAYKNLVWLKVRTKRTREEAEIETASS